MIDEKKLIVEIQNRLKYWESKAAEYDEAGERYEYLMDVCDGKATELTTILSIVNEQPKIGEWIPCSERMPEEHEVPAPIFDPVTLAETDVRYYIVSDIVQITVKDEKGKRFVYNDYTINGKWYFFNEDLDFEVLAWLPLSEPWEGEADGK